MLTAFVDPDFSVATCIRVNPIQSQSSKTCVLYHLEGLSFEGVFNNLKIACPLTEPVASFWIVSDLRVDSSDVLFPSWVFSFFGITPGLNLSLDDCSSWHLKLHPQHVFPVSFESLTLQYQGAILQGVLNSKQELPAELNLKTIFRRQLSSTLVSSSHIGRDACAKMVLASFLSTRIALSALWASIMFSAARVFPRRQNQISFGYALLTLLF